ncbi:hypothetical protein B0H67DRAFT_553529 [Lasiosphaeris hirsuta]|uniref:Galactose oxidase n=1 Tax=Lasiosphaeris hirsuta TaxID=260670 RepID=A0AA40AFI4_9PEZI|nr:hypothetical protein B0H67DRAFT_553529 [Lasiosphaeris hirsuta]
MLAPAGNALPTGASSLSTAGAAVSTATIRRAALLATLLLSTLAAAADTALPYTSTSILLSGSVGLPDGNSDTAYIFTPKGGSVDLLSVNISSTLSASALKPQTLTSGLPFLGSGSIAFTPSLLDNGTLTVLAGDCSVATDSALWTYTPAVSSGSTKSKVSWARHATAPSKNWDYGQGGPYFLGGSLSFSAQLAPVISDPILYVYGGMCPWPNATTSSWQSSATYSNRMLKISPPSSDKAYTVSYAPSTGPPIAEAGFTFTELAPSLSNRSGIVTQQTSHVLLGGHTQQAFINMSTAAIWSLPEETWNFVSIASPSAIPPSAKADLLATKDTVLAAAVAGDVDSRSGHTTVLSEDGSSLVILGGWVGDTTQAAEPQLAIIKMGAAYGDWQFVIPPLQPAGSGIYGHGAALLPGNMMMVYGGYTIPPASKKRFRRASTIQMFYNITSQTWSNTYTNPGQTTRPSNPDSGSGSDDNPNHPGPFPSSVTPSTGPAPSSPPESSPASEDEGSRTKLGLGLGLGLGIPLLLALVFFAACLYRRRNKRRARRDEALRGLAQGMPGSLGRGDEHGEMLQRDHDGPLDEDLLQWDADSARDWYTGGHDPYVQGRRSLGYETLRGAGGQRGGYQAPAMPAPVGGRGRVATRGLYQPSTGLGNGYDFAPLRTPMKNEIHPIYEDDEEEGDDGDLGAQGLISPQRDDDDDPFATPMGPATPTTGLFPPPGSSNRSESTPSPEHGQQDRGQAQDPEVQGWVSDVDAADAVLTAKIGRHGSTTTTPPRFQHQRQQSRGSARSSVHNLAAPAGDFDEARTGSNLSDKSAFSFVQGAERTLSSRPLPQINTQGNQERQSQAHHFRSAFGGSSAPSVPGLTPAATEARLGTSGSTSSSSTHTFSTAKSTFATLQAEAPGLLFHGDPQSPSHQHQTDEAVMVDDDDYITVPGSPSKSKPRRSWFGSLRRVFSGGTSQGSESSRGDSPTHDSLLGGGGDYEPPRLVGMGADGQFHTLTKRKQGREAWDPSSFGEPRVSGEGEWDVERAVEQRLVQVMFTVPKERLRVVNAEIEREEEAVVVDPEEEEEEVEEEEDGRGWDEKQEVMEQRRQFKIWEQQELEQEPQQQHREQPQEQRQRQHRLKEGDLEKMMQQEREREEITRFKEEHQFKFDGKHRGRDSYLEPPTAGISPSTSLRTSSITTTTPIHTAEAIRMERPRTRVLEMVESIESRSSRGNSPSGSPTR